MISLKYEIAETFEIKEEIIQDQVTITVQKRNKTNKSTSCTVNKKEDDMLDFKPKLETLKKQEIEESEQEKKHTCKKCDQTNKHIQIKSESTKSTQREDDGASFFTDISSGNKSDAKTLIEYEIDETLEIKEEIIQDMETITSNQHDPAYESKLCTVDVSNNEILDVKCEPWTPEKHEIPESKQEIKYSCKKCGKTYSQNKPLKSHQKFECSIKPQFKCELCDKQFKQKQHMNVHVDHVHQKSNSKKSVLIHKCDKCPRSYTRIHALSLPKRFKHAETIPQFICDLCGYESNTKGILVRHMTACHSQSSKTRHKCDKCMRTYKWLTGLTRHKILVHAVDKPEFNCDFCEYKSNAKYNLVRHVTSCHSQASKSSYKCKECARTYNWPTHLARHIRLVHATVKPNFFCDFCGYKFNRKCTLVKHMTSRHSQISKSMYTCDKCSRSYRSLGGFYEHIRLKHAAVVPEFTCDICYFKTKRKRHLSKHMTTKHLSK
ncbi:zinc finger protein 99-like [Belonocnema kinseyi]|uniref:zinc finger protein 99-like n=1 Tax=Belonocnema kinseyi TaxID=2817044 RepID=UPI00143D20DF|nr:zinc finger protein 99-like [Belonocnema kinseyi]